MVCEIYLSKTIKIVLIFKDTTMLLNNISNTEANDQKKKTKKRQDIWVTLRICNRRRKKIIWLLLVCIS